MYDLFDIWWPSHTWGFIVIMVVSSIYKYPLVSKRGGRILRIWTTEDCRIFNSHYQNGPVACFLGNFWNLRLQFVHFKAIFLHNIILFWFLKDTAGSPSGSTTGGGGGLKPPKPPSRSAPAGGDTVTGGLTSRYMYTYSYSRRYGDHPRLGLIIFNIVILNTSKTS